MNQNLKWDESKRGAASLTEQVKQPQTKKVKRVKML